MCGFSLDCSRRGRPSKFHERPEDLSELNVVLVQADVLAESNKLNSCETADHSQRQRVSNFGVIPSKLNCSTRSLILPMSGETGRLQVEFPERTLATGCLSWIYRRCRQHRKGFAIPKGDLRRKRTSAVSSIRQYARSAED